MSVVNKQDRSIRRPARSVKHNKHTLSNNSEERRLWFSAIRRRDTTYKGAESRGGWGGAGRSGDKILCRNVQDSGVLSVGFAEYHTSGPQNFEVVPTFFKKFVYP